MMIERYERSGHEIVLWGEGKWVKYEDVEEALNIVSELAEHNRPKASIRDLIKRAQIFKDSKL